ncbi:hypothetical protein [Shewanella japonica]|uniref:hypothetical protein n=1 Tax=Shewanella japonica TaxID=93973 RepID=UPI000E736F2C|nr:hypothetical protein [Shewanella japonica]
MKKSVLALSVISALFLAGCSSDDDSSSPEPTPEPSPEMRTIEVSTALKNVSEMNAMSSGCLPVNIPVPQDDVELPGIDHPVCKIDDSEGNPHFIRTNDYEITVTDQSGIKYTETIEDITNFEFEFDVIGDAEIHVDFIGTLEGSHDEAYSYYTVETPLLGKKVGRDETEITVELDNESYSYVTFQANNDDIVFEQTTITTSDEYHFGISGQSENELESKLIHAYRYIKQDADLFFTARNSVEAKAWIDFLPRKHYEFGELKIDPNSGDLIIKEPDFGTPIGITPVPANAAVLPNQVDGAENPVYNTETGAVTFTATLPKLGNEVEPWIYPNFEFTEGKYQLNQFDFSFDVTTNIETSMFMNVYLIDVDGETLNAVVYPTGEVNVMKKIEGTYTSVDEFEGEGALQTFMLQYGDYKLASRSDGTKRQTNFIIRVADDNTEEFTFTVLDYTVETVDLYPIEPIPGVVSEENLSNLEIDSIDSDSGAVKAVVKKDGNAYVFAKTTGNTTLKEHSFDIDVTGFENGYMNIYLQTTDAAGKKVNSRFDYHMSGEHKGKFICSNTDKYPCPTEVFESYDSFEDLVTAYGDYKVRKYMNGLLIGNFFLRNPAAIAGSEVTVNRFTVNP